MMRTDSHLGKSCCGFLGRVFGRTSDSVAGISDRSSVMSLVSSRGVEFRRPKIEHDGNHQQDQRKNGHGCTQPEPEGLKGGLINVDRQRQHRIRSRRAEEHEWKGEVVEM